MRPNVRRKTQVFELQKMKPSQRADVRNLVAPNSETLVLVHPFYSSGRGPGKMKDVQGVKKMVYTPDLVLDYNQDKRRSIAYFRNLNRQLKSAKGPVVIFCEINRIDAMKELVRGMSLRVPVIFVKTVKNSPQPLLGNVKGREHAFEEHFADRDVKDLEGMKAGIYDMNIRRVKIAGEQYVRDRHGWSELLCVETLNSWMNTRNFQPVIKSRISEITFPDRRKEKKKKSAPIVF